jgi:hypothetical protein
MDAKKNKNNSKITTKNKTCLLCKHGKRERGAKKQNSSRQSREKGEKRGKGAQK